MAYNTNPFVERMSEKTTSDLDFVRLFSPKILEKLEEDAFKGAVHVFRSAPGAGKTTLLRAFTPTALRSFWNSRHSDELAEAFQNLVTLGVVDPSEGPQFLGVLLSCAAGYADLPPGAAISQEGLFRALLDCRIVLRTLRNLSSFLGFSNADQLSTITISYSENVQDLKGIPKHTNPNDLILWAEQHEKQVYAELDALEKGQSKTPCHLQFEGALWLQSVIFLLEGKPVAPKRLLMIDDLHKLRRKQRSLLIDELATQRAQIPIWLAERSVALGNELLSQGVREGRDLKQYALEDMWNGPKGTHQFSSFALNILDRRMTLQNMVASRSFSQCLRQEFTPNEIRTEVEKGVQAFNRDVQGHQSNVRYTEWLARAAERSAEPDLESLFDLYITRTLMFRNEVKRQLSLALPLPANELDERDSSQLKGAVEIFVHEELGIPYYFGIDRLCVMASTNIEELLSLASALYIGLQHKQVLRKPDLVLSPFEQEKLLKDAARRKRDFIPKNHTNGLKAQRLLDSIGHLCASKTFLPTAPYAPGVTGIRISHSEMNTLNSGAGSSKQHEYLLRVLAECTAENLLIIKSSAASTSRDSGTIFYLNRTLCAYYDLPLQQGGWQDVSVTEMIDWMNRGPSSRRQGKLEIN